MLQAKTTDKTTTNKKQPQTNSTASQKVSASLTVSLPLPIHSLPLCSSDVLVRYHETDNLPRCRHVSLLEVKGFSQASSSTTGVSCFFTHASPWLCNPLFYPLAKDALSAAPVTAGCVWAQEKLLKDIGFFERFAHNSAYHLRNICFFKLYGNARCASEIRIWPWGTKSSSLFTADNAQLIFMSSSFSRDSTPLFAGTVSREISKDNSTLSIAIFASGGQIFTEWHWPVAWVPKAERFKSSWGNLQPSNKQPQKSQGRRTHNDRMLLETLRRLLGSCDLPLLLCNGPSPTVSCLPLPFHSAPRIRSSIHGAKGETFWGGFNTLDYPALPFSLTKSSMQFLSFLLSYSM